MTLPTSESSSTEAVDVLHAALQRLHQDHGELSTRSLARQIGKHRISHGTVHTAIGGDRVVTWPKLRLIVEALGGDASHFHQLWTAAHTQIIETRKIAAVTRAGSVQPLATPAALSRFTAETGHSVSTQAAIFSFDELTTMLRGYQHREEPVFDTDKVAVRLAELLPPQAAGLIRSLPRTTAAVALAHVVTPHAEPIVELLGTALLDELLDALDDDVPERDQLSRWQPLSPPPPVSSPPADHETNVLAMPPYQAAAFVYANMPDLVRQWHS